MSRLISQGNRSAILLLAIFGCAAMLSGQSRVPAHHRRKFKFESFPAPVYKGPFTIPKNFVQTKDGDFEDTADHMDTGGRFVAPPEVNFAGEYWLVGHSCGTACLWYSMWSLRTGTEFKSVAMFGEGYPLPVTKDGQPYLTELYTRPNSGLLIAEYGLNPNDPSKPRPCRQRYYILEAGKLRAISKTFPFCTEEPQR